MLKRLSQLSRTLLQSVATPEEVMDAMDEYFKSKQRDGDIEFESEEIEMGTSRLEYL